MKKKHRKQKRTSTATRNKHLRSGTKAVKNILLQEKPYCDICGSGSRLQLHHTYLVRHGFSTKLEWSVLLCACCHRKFHQRWDRYLDITFEQDPNADFYQIYQTLSKL